MCAGELRQCPERERGKEVLAKLQQLGEQVRRLYRVWVDGGYSGELFVQFLMDTGGKCKLCHVFKNQRFSFSSKNVGWLSAPREGRIAIDAVLKTTSMCLKTPRPRFTLP